jgi:hypothetical protein
LEGIDHQEKGSRKTAPGRKLSKFKDNGSRRKRIKKELLKKEVCLMHRKWWRGTWNRHPRLEEDYANLPSACKNGFRKKGLTKMALTADWLRIKGELSAH